MPDAPGAADVPHALGRPLMSPERWREISGVVDAALDLTPAERTAYLARACASDAERVEIQRLLTACERMGGFLDEHASAFVAPPGGSGLTRAARQEATTLERLRGSLAERYAAERVIGRGGMAIVCLARDVKHGRPVAIKILRPELAAVLGADRFLREIETCARLSHPHVLPLLDSGEADGLLYYIMPYVEGESLRDRLERERQLPVDEALRIAREVAGALDYTHRHNVLHRDLKPENVLLIDGQAVVADFGIARAITRAAAGAAGDIDPITLTATGFALGTPAYMSPEQASGDRELDGRSDIYALGCLLYEMLAGQPPFTGPTAESIVRQHLLTSPLTLSAAREDVAPELEAAVTRALAKSPGDRFSSMGEFAGALDRSLTTGTTPTRFTDARSPAWRTPSRVLVMAAIPMILAGIAVATKVRTPQSLVVEQATQLTHAPELELDPAISPDGRFIAYAAGPINDTRIYVRQLSGGRDLVLTDTVDGPARWPRWSPDGSRIAFHSISGIHIVPAFGGAVRRVVRSGRVGSGMPEVHSAAWSPDGAMLAYAGRDSGIFTLRLVDGVTRRIATVFRPSGLSWSPDGSSIAYVSGNPQFTIAMPFIGNIAPSVIGVVPVAGGNATSLTDSGSLNTSPVWMPDGRRLLFVSSRAGGRDIFILRLRSDGPPEAPVRLTTGLQAHTIFLSADGRRVAYATFKKTANIFSLPITPQHTASLSDAQAVTRGGHTIEGLSVSPDGRWIAFDSNISGNQDIYRMPMAGGEPERLTHGEADDFLPSWSPDGREIAYFAIEYGNRNIVIMNADGSGGRRVTAGPAQDAYPHWSPDGRMLAFTSDGSIQIVSRQASGAFGAPRRLVTGARPRWSPDGKWMAYVDRGVGLGLANLRDGSTRTLFADSTASVGELMSEWSGDSRTVYYQFLAPDGSWSIRAIPVTGGESRVLLHVDDRARPFSDVFASHDQQLYFTVTDFEGDVWLLTLGAD